ncbi:MAG: hydroxymethylglutaryl-CoA lyase [Paracoccaceae bacterium]|nr:hydroxymethylglutaryl-CoA lyase [Paracoccaceae bacterium]
MIGPEVEVYEVGPRDGLQNDPRDLPADWKVSLVDRLSHCGFKRIEVASFVSPRAVPAMKDSARVMAGIRRAPGVGYVALVPNLKGYLAARDAGADEVAVFVSASEGFSRANVGCTVAEGIERAGTVAALATSDGIPVRGYVSCVTDCPFDGSVCPETVAEAAVALRDLGCHEVSLGDTIGRATPNRLGRMLEAVLKRVPADCLAGHFHDTAGRALANVETALAFGLRKFDASIGGLGGCPFAPGAPGNVATESVAERLRRLGYAIQLDVERLAAVARFARADSALEVPEEKGPNNVGERQKET